MNLAEVAALLRVQDHPDDNCEDVIALLDTHIAQVARRIADLERLELYLGELRGCCHEGNVAREWDLERARSRFRRTGSGRAWLVPHDLGVVAEFVAAPFANPSQPADAALAERA